MQLEVGDKVYHKIAGEGIVKDIYIEFSNIEKMPIQYATIQFKYEHIKLKISELTI